MIHICNFIYGFFQLFFRCTGFVKFVELCSKRLQVLYVWETSLLEDSNYDLTQLISTVSTLLGRSWQPEYIPVW